MISADASEACRFGVLFSLGSSRGPHFGSCGIPQSSPGDRIQFHADIFSPPSQSVSTKRSPNAKEICSIGSRVNHFSGPLLSSQLVRVGLFWLGAANMSLLFEHLKMDLSIFVSKASARLWLLRIVITGGAVCLFPLGFYETSMWLMVRAALSQ